MKSSITCTVLRRNDLIFESLPYHNVVFVQCYDEEAKRTLENMQPTVPMNNHSADRIMGDCSGSEKDYSFRRRKLLTTL